MVKFKSFSRRENVSSPYAQEQEAFVQNGNMNDQQVFIGMISTENKAGIDCKMGRKYFGCCANLKRRIKKN